MSVRLLAGRYELLEKIGDGGMAVVYKARCRLLNRFVAIKILKPEFARNVKFIENFRRESQSAARLSHPNIVNIYDVGREGNIHYIVMELIEGPILSDLIAKEGPLEWRRAVEIAKQISSALAFAHKNQIIHRDVKPHNILLTPDGTAKITDFGIAKALNSSRDDNETATVMGSVHYFSPEQARGGYVDEKSDIYALGIVLFEMLTGQVPFDGDSPVSVALMHINQPMPEPRMLNPNVPVQIQDVVMKATDKLQINRYATADEMFDALAHAEFDAMMEEGTSKKGNSAPEDEYYGEDGEEAEFTEDGYYEGEEGAIEETEGMKEEKGKGKKGKKEKKPLDKVKVLAVIAALVVAVPISMLISHLIGSAGESKEIDCPDFRGMTFEAAKEVAEEFKLEIEEGDKVYSVDYEEGQICSQSPDVNSKVKEGKTISVNISKGAKDGTVPNLVGKSQTDAEYALKKYGFKVGSVTSQPDNLPQGIVISQNPGPGEEVTPGSRINFVVSAGKSEEEGIIPYLIGSTKDQASTALESEGFVLGNVTYEASKDYDDGKIMWQSAEAGKTAPKGASVDVKISSGANGVSSQDAQSLSSIYVDYSAAQNDVFWLTVTVSDDSGTHNIITRAQRIKADGGENIQLEGVGLGTVTVIFDNDVVATYTVNFGA